MSFKLLVKYALSLESIFFLFIWKKTEQLNF